MRGRSRSKRPPQERTPHWQALGALWRRRRVGKPLCSAWPMRWLESSAGPSWPPLRPRLASGHWQVSHARPLLSCSGTKLQTHRPLTPAGLLFAILATSLCCHAWSPVVMSSQQPLLGHCQEVHRADPWCLATGSLMQWADQCHRRLPLLAPRVLPYAVGRSVPSQTPIAGSTCAHVCRERPVSGSSPSCGHGGRHPGRSAGPEAGCGCHGGRLPLRSGTGHPHSCAGGVVGGSQTRYPSQNPELHNPALSVLQLLCCARLQHV